LRQWGLAEHAAAMGLPLSPLAVDQLVALLQLLAKWNRVYNLTSLSEESKWVSHHLLDSLSIMSVLPQGRLIDVGSGGGFPGLPIAVANPHRDVVLLDSNNKKTAFLRQAVAELGLSNVAVETCRVESFRPVSGFDVVVSRAFSDLKSFLELAGHLCNEAGTLLAMKGVYPADEIASLPPGTVEKVVRLEVPMFDAQRHAVFLHPPASRKG
jgi:16S rRNA (guanine527-N7)-methyltransferase